jgi:DNA polymerase-1
MVRFMQDNPEDGFFGINSMDFDVPILAKHHGLDILGNVRRLYDIDLALRCVDPPPSGKGDNDITYPRGYYSLNEACKRAGVPGKNHDLKALARKWGGFDKIPQDDPTYLYYLDGDIRATEALFRTLPSSPYIRREMIVGAIMAQMRVNGFRVDVQEAELEVARQEVRGREIAEELSRIFGVPNVGKKFMSTHIAKRAFEVWLIESGVNPDDIVLSEAQELPVTNREVLGELAAKYPAVADVCSMVAEVTSARTVYGTALEHVDGDGWVHPSVRPRQASGRWSITSPGMTVYGKRKGRHVERRIFLPDDDDHVLFACDFGQVDARAVAFHSQDPNYINIFSSGKDLHTEIALQLFGDPDMREACKPISHGWSYGRGVKAIVAATGLPFETVNQFSIGMGRNFPGVVRWQGVVRQRGERGTLLDNGFGRKLRVDPRHSYTQAPAHVGQGCTRDIVAQSLLHLLDSSPDLLKGLKTVVHDEMVFSVRKKDAEEAREEVLKAMTFNLGNVPIVADGSKFGRNWAEVYEK